MENKRISGFSVFLIIMALIALLWLFILVFGSMTHGSVTAPSPWTVARCMLHG